MATSKHSKLGIASFLLSVIGLFLVGFGYNSDFIFFHKEMMSCMVVIPFLMGLISLFIPETRKTYGILALVIGCVGTVSVWQAVDRP